MVRARIIKSDSLWTRILEYILKFLYFIKIIIKKKTGTLIFAFLKCINPKASK